MKFIIECGHIEVAHEADVARIKSLLPKNDVRFSPQCRGNDIRHRKVPSKRCFVTETRPLSVRYTRLHKCIIETKSLKTRRFLIKPIEIGSKVGWLRLSVCRM